MSIITHIKAREILDSRGNPTVEVELSTKTFSVIASVPSGASTGKHEAVELRDHNKRYLGKGVEKAVNNINKIIAPKLKRKNCTKQSEIDQLMIKLDGTENKSKLGANALLAVSLAVAKAGAKSQNLELFKYLAKMGENKKLTLPRPFFNVINGGKHAEDDLAFQEFMIVPKSKSFKEALRMGSETYHHLKQIIAEKYGKNAANVGDEGGFAPPLKTAEEALDLLVAAVKKAGYSGKIDIAIDCAASEFHSNGLYYLPQKKSKEQMIEYYLKLIKKYPIISLEDPFEEEDFTSFADLRKISGIQIVGDDLTVTNVHRIRKAINLNSCNCLLLKVNQIGTLTESLEAVKLAHTAGWKVMVSHRSGETEDTFIADLAVGIGCGMIKAGAPCRGERIAKYNQLLRIEEKIK